MSTGRFSSGSAKKSWSSYLGQFIQPGSGLGLKGIAQRINRSSRMRVHVLHGKGELIGALTHHILPRMLWDHHETLRFKGLSLIASELLRITRRMERPRASEGRGRRIILSTVT